MIFGLAFFPLTSSPRPTNRRGGRRLRPTALPLILLTGLCFALPATRAEATIVSGIQAKTHDGQTFLTWLTPPGTGWTYRVYRSTSRIRNTNDLALATALGSVGDSTWCDRRLSSLTGQIFGYCTDSTAKALTFVRGLFVATTEVSGPVYYAVTAQSATGTEDKTISLGTNALSSAIAETYGLPRPVYQRVVVKDGIQAEVYTLWTGNRATAAFPKMANRPSTPYDCSMVRGGDGPFHALMFRPHVRGGSFMDIGMSPVSSEYMFQMDDYTNTPDVNTFWFGYVETYNINSGTNVPPISGYVCDYTMRRVVWTLKWAKRNFPVDPNRVYVTASSMGGICGVSLAMSQPDLIAAVMVSVPRFDFSQIADPNLPVCAFNEGESQRVTCDRLWGPVPEDLPLDTGVPVYTRLNAGAMARQLESRFVPPIIAFNGRNDVIVGWAEKIPFYTAMRESRAGGMFFWDTRDHAGTATSAWVPMQDYSYVYRFCINRSFPALTNCSADNNPGNGLASDGDSIGTINGFVEWDTSLVDRSDSWQVKLNTRSLTTRWGIVTAPESLTVDVTPRRLQTFSPVAGIDYQWTVTRRSDAAIVQMGVVRLDAMGVMTVPGVKVYPGGSVLVIGTGAYAVSGVDPRHPGGRAPMIAPFASPTRASMAITVTWAHDGDATVDLLDLAGRQVRRIDAGSVIAGPRTVRFDASGLSSGIYFVCARQAGTTDVRRLALLH